MATFRAPLEAGGPSFMPTQLLVVPADTLAALPPRTKRVLAIFGTGHTERLGLLPLPGGGRYLLLRKALCAQLGAAVGQELTVTLAPDPSPDYVDLPDELAEALAAWPEAEAAFRAHSAAMRRAVARKIADAKRPDTRARYAVEVAERLARGGHPLRAAHP